MAYAEDEPEPEVRGWFFNGTNLAKIPCFRESFMAGIGSGLIAGLAYNLGTSRSPYKLAFGVYSVVLFGYFGNCRYNYSMREHEMKMLRYAMEKHISEKNPEGSESTAKQYQSDEEWARAQLQKKTNIPTYEKMTAEVLKIINFPTQISSITPLAWSPDYRLVIGTKKGIFIYTLILDPYNTEEELNFKKDFIPTKPMQPDYEPLMGQERVSQLSTKMKDLLIQDRVFAPFHPNADSHSHMRYVGWSPGVNLKQYDGFFLISLGFDYSFKLYFETEQDEWTSVLDLRKILLDFANNNKNILKENTSKEKIDITDPKYAELCRKAYFTATLCISWKEQNRFYSGQEGGQVVFWNLETNNKICIRDIYQTKLPSITAINSLNCSENNTQIVIVGSLNGQVKCIIKDSKKISAIPDYLYLVWEEEDRLKVLQIKVIQITEKIHDLLIAKANFVIRVTVQVNLDINSVKVLSQISLNAGTNYVSGIEPILEKSSKSFKILIAASKGKLLEWSPDEENASNRKVDLQMRIDRRHYNCWGLTASPNKAVYCLLENISSFNDHLLLREPARIIFFTTASKHLIREKVGSKELQPDFMELFRVFYLKSGLEMATTFSNLNCQWWINCVASRQCSQADDLHQAIEIRLRLEEAVAVVKRTKVDAAAKFHACKFIIKFSKDEDSVNLAQNALRYLSDEAFDCIICGENLIEEEIQFLACNNGHKLPRCGLSQQPAVDSEFKSCSWCDCPYMLETIDNNATCLLCTGPIRQLDT